ncbi:LOW QUALITY PROTEIN: ubiquitin carboxyl-terminal hydrolase 36 [Anopheles bellator]|uniref:LOW QUALITY PROTEIN: ubiquitin carboxyl-terminal hydrolase 36 n=1 Tax=Anopheles bellator TaxID=139047 RepID=UPI0026472EA2|nr:LOW QUALITY PROTEIN: ubiquitin carboxyl-terminal hydrolase 36 [Anopheles bellator]
MPIQMVCDSTPSLVSAALRDSLHSTANNGRSTAAALSAASAASNYNGVTAHGSTGAVGPPASSGLGPGRLFRRSMFDSSHDNNDDDPGEDSEPSDLVETIAQSLRQGQQAKSIRYDEAPSYSASLDKLKSKYIVLKATNADVVLASGGGDKNTSSVTTNGNGGGGLMQTPKLSANGLAITTVPVIGGGGAVKYGTSIISATARLTGSQQNGTTVSMGSGSAPGTAGKDTATLPTPKRTLFPRENVQIGWKTTGRKWLVGAGMVNMGNTCYLNSTLQALFHVPAIANWLLSDVQHRERCDDGGSGGSCIICAMAKTLEESQSNHSAIKPYLVYSKLRLVCKHLVQGRQEDAHEFLRYLVEAMEKSFLGRYKNSKELDQYSKETTPLNQILGGYLRSEVKCLSCQHVSTTFQHFEDLLLDIRKANSIDEALELYFDRERLEDMGYKCEACKRRVAATKQFSLERAPFVLCIQLKRFAMMGGKINKHVELRSRLDLTPYSNQRTANGALGGKLTYRLTSMVTHLGSTQHCGHYTAIGQTDGGAYHVFDDSSVRPVGIHNVMSTNAYILFFELESAAGASVGLLNGTTKAPQTAGHPSSTATLTSMGHMTANGGAALGSSSIGAGSTGGSSGTPGKGTGIASSPLRVLGSGGGNGTAGGLFPSKLDTKPGFIGPVLPPSAKSPISASVTVAASQGTSTKGALGTTTLSSTSAVGDGINSSPSSNTSTLSSPSTTVSPSPSPVKSVNSSLLSQSNKSKSAANTMATTTTVAAAAPGSNNGASALKLLNGNHTKQSSLAAVSPPLPSMPKLLFSSTPNGGQRCATGTAGCPSGGSVVSLVPYETDDDSDADNSSEDEARNKRGKLAQGYNSGKKSVSLKRNGHGTGQENDHHDDDDEDNDDGGDDRHSHSPQIIKNKAGLWKVSKSSTAGQLTYPDSSSNSGSASSSKTSSPSSSPPQQRNGVAAGSGDTAAAAAATATSAPSAAGVQPLTNGGQRHQQQHTTQNGYNHQQRALKSRSSSPAPAAAVQLLLKYSHRGYGAPVKSWNGQQTEMERELATERREERKRQIEDDRETEMDRGRMKKVKNVAPNGGAPPQHGNQFQNFQNYQNGGGGGGMKWNGGNRNGNQQYNNGYHRGGGPGGGGFNHHQNGGGHHRHGGGFRNGGGRRFGGGRNGGFHPKAHYHHQRSEASSGGGLASGGGGPSGSSNGFYHR